MSPETFATHRRFVSTSLGRIATYEMGAGPTALFVHGYPLSAYHWRHQLAALAGRRRCVAIDLLGLGYSEPAAGTKIHYHTQARMIAEVADALSLGELDLVGNDSGGAIAQLVAVANPDRIRSLTLTNCEVRDNNPPAALLPMVELARAGQLGAMLGTVVDDPKGTVAGFAPFFERPEQVMTPERIAYDLAPIVATPERTQWAADYLTELAPEVTLSIVPELEAFEKPTLVVWGDADEYMPFESAEWLRDHVPGVRALIRLPGAKLFFAEESPERLNEALWEFWQREAPAAAA